MLHRVPEIQTHASLNAHTRVAAQLRWNKFSYSVESTEGALGIGGLHLPDDGSTH